LEHGFFYRLSSILWKAVVSIIVALAIYVSFGRFLMSNVGSYGDDILRELNDRSPFLIEAQAVTGDWHSFTPELVLTGIRLTSPDSTDLPLELVEGRVAIDILESLKTWSLQTLRVRLDQLVLRGELTEEGKLHISGMGGGGNIGPWLELFLLNLEQVTLSNNQLFLDLPDGGKRIFDLDLVLRREGSFRQLEADLSSRTTGTDIFIFARGLGNPASIEKFSGDVYLKVVNSDLTAVQQFLPKDLPVKLSGGAALEAWITLDHGNPTIDAEITGRDINIQDAAGSWQVPIDYVSLKSSIAQRGDRWTLFASDLELEHGGTSLRLPRLQFDVTGDSLRMRSTNVPLVPINALLLEMEATPEAIGDVFRILDPRGELTTLELNVADYHDPIVDWEISANFEGVEVDSWRGAPGVTAANGYVQMDPGGGFVILDSHQFSMLFPTVYRDARRFDDFYGTVYVDWSSTDVTVSSGLIMAHGIEGQATAVFGLNIPLTESKVGLEMDLLVGLKNTHPIHRTKYIPYILNEALTGWLKDSIGEGKIEEGAFLWRGSLRKGASALRTVQLFFNVADTKLNYYAGWPPLSGLEGTVLINDTDVSVWSERATLFNSDIDFLSAEAWLDENSQMMLAISSEMKGDAADGIQVVNESPLSSIVGEAFTDWKLSGELETSLELQINLNDPGAPPQVEVDTRWNGVDVFIDPGALKLEAVSGNVAYSSERGFSSQQLIGSIWGEALQAELWQRNPGEEHLPSESAFEYDAQRSITGIEMSTRVNVLDIKEWLNLDLLSLAEGETAAELLIEVPPGSTPEVTISADMAGIGLDLPDPWRKPAEVQRSLIIGVPLAGGSQVVSLNLENELFLQVLLTDSEFAGVSLGIQRPSNRPEAGIAHIGGHASLVDGDQWQDFLDQYVYSDFTESEESGSLDESLIEILPDPPQAASVTAVQVPETDGDLKVLIEDLQADRLIIYGQYLSDAVFTMEVDEGVTRVQGETDWVRGELIYFEDDRPGQLQIEQLEIAGLKQLNFESDEGGDEGDSFEIPDMDVVLANLSYEAQSLGKLDFKVRRAEQQLLIEDAVGNIAGLRLSPEQPGSLSWSQEPKAIQTRLNAQLNFTDLGETLEQLSYQRIIETSSGELDLTLEWPGGPQDFTLASAKGALGINVAEGRFLDTPSGASGTLRVVGILNLADIVQRLSLDLNSMFESGIPFHSIEGEVFFHGGSIEVAKMDVEGRSSSFQFAGLSDVASKSLDGELIATLPVASNLPWVAALALGLPVAAGVFVVSKVFEKQVNRFSSAIYKISGSWLDPEVKFDRIFDTSSTKGVIIPPGSTVDGEGANVGVETETSDVVTQPLADETPPP
jgi:uncharacterized protein (TIGR02099 family)